MSNSKFLDFIKQEDLRQSSNIELIASENFVSDDIKAALGSCLTNKYAEGYPYHRYYGGCQVIDEIEDYTRYLFKKVFNTDYHVNVQSHSGSQANEAAYRAVLKPGDKVVSMELNSGGHLTHGLPANFSGQLYNFKHYHVDENGLINKNEVETLLFEEHPKLLVVGASSYSREIDYSWFKKEIDEFSPGTLLMVDMAHVAGLIAAGYHKSPFGYADIVTSTTQKTLRGPRGGLIFCKPEFKRAIDSAVFPGTQGGPAMNIIAAKGICAEEALTYEFREYIEKVINNASTMAYRFEELGYNVVTHGTDNHMFIIDLRKNYPDLTGKEVQDMLDEYHITVNKQCVPNEERSPFETSGIRIGTAAMTTKGYDATAFAHIASEIDSYIRRYSADKKLGA